MLSKELLQRFAQRSPITERGKAWSAQTKTPAEPQDRRAAAEYVQAPNSTATFIDNGPGAVTQRERLEAIHQSPDGVAQRRLIESINLSPRVAAQRILQTRIDSSARIVTQRQQLRSTFGSALQFTAAAEDAGPQMQAAPENATVQSLQSNSDGLPKQLKAGIESLSGMSMNHVKVTYNSDKPAQLNAHAYTRGSEIHVGSGQERHLPHEAWHVVQQAQGRVSPTLQTKGGVSVNDDAGLESEADVMGEQALAEGAAQLTQSGDVGNSAVPLMSVSAADESRHGEANPPLQRRLKVGEKIYTHNSQISWKQDELFFKLRELENAGEIKAVLAHWAEILDPRKTVIQNPRKSKKPKQPQQQRKTKVPENTETESPEETKLPDPDESQWTIVFGDWAQAVDAASNFIESGDWGAVKELIRWSTALDSEGEQLLELAVGAEDPEIIQAFLRYRFWSSRIRTVPRPDKEDFTHAFMSFFAWGLTLSELKTLGENQQKLKESEEHAKLQKQAEAAEQQGGVDEIVKAGKKQGALRDASNSLLSSNRPKADLAYAEYKLMQTRKVIDYHNLDDAATINAMEPGRVQTRMQEITYLQRLANHFHVQVGTMSVRGICAKLESLKFQEMSTYVRDYCTKHNITTLGADGIGWSEHHVIFGQLKSSVLPPLQEMQNETEHMRETRIPIDSMLIHAAKQLEGIVAKGEALNGEFTIKGEKSSREIVLSFSNEAALAIPAEQYQSRINQVLSNESSTVYRKQTLVEHVEQIVIYLPKNKILKFIKKDGQFFQTT